MPVFRRPTAAPSSRRSEPITEQDRAAVIARLESMPPHEQLWFFQLLVGMGLVIHSSVVELAVPVGRALAGRRGVQTGPALGSLLTFLAFRAYTSAIGAKVTAEGGSAGEDDADSRLGRWLDRTFFSGAEYLPAFGAALSSTVVLRKRSPLWGLALWPVVRVVAVMVLAADASRLKKRHAADALQI
jgi:hypothetical protein